MADRRMFDREIFKSSVMVHLGYNNPEFGLEAQRIFETLILKADDHGRGRLLPEVIRGDAFISVPDVFAQVTPEMILDWVKQIEAQGALVRYEADGENYYYLTGWDKYQRGGWQKTSSQLPEPPLTEDGHPADTERTPSGQTADTGQTTDESKVNKKVKKKKRNTTKITAPEGGDAKDGRHNTPVGRFSDIYQELWNEKFIVTPGGSKHLTDTYKLLGKDIEEFDRRVRNFLTDPWVKENRPGPDHLYRNINKYGEKPKKELLTF